MEKLKIGESDHQPVEVTLKITGAEEEREKAGGYKGNNTMGIRGDQEVSKHRKIWKLVNKERKKRKAVSEDIKVEEWEKYFSQLLEGDKEEQREPEEQRNLSTDQEKVDEDIEKQVRKLKKKKATGKDRIGNEAWLYSEGLIRAKEVLKRV